MVNGKKIRSLRECEGLTVEEFARKVGMSQTMASFIESGVKQPGLELAKRIADYFGLKVDDLLNGKSA